MKVLFVCTGNTCRSPMAEALFMHLSKVNNKNINASSVGTSVFFPQPVNPKALKALTNIGINDFEHMSKQISKSDVSENDLILTMTSAHKLALKSAFPVYRDKIYTLNEKAFGKDSDISDPFGGSQETYDKCAEEIFAAVEKILCML